MEKFTGRPAKDGHTKLRNKVIEVIEFRIERCAKQIPLSIRLNMYFQLIPIHISKCLSHLFKVVRESVS